ncbi:MULTISPECIES: TIGR02647 family protein [Pseudoalteromonas]|uniref:DNA-binding protein n=2 Tax=Pseudoalteromonas TaxID=53246 RepID=A0A0F4QYE3_9GAMM|nr:MULTISPECIES: TIGR02647 family protein [Pseudoalteromonas]ALU45522.1 DNA-binding protein [Pseudoalteromonas rubra]KAF7781915.1 hypothetical protein PRUB_b1286 [Pseudoalteromonas rubra]KJZ12711.1 DNA-binding protein [Pseudoalteromonas rubra]KNC65270.1 DNA-binding protein [Pseudoalteromonas rubra]MCF2906793.1 TIGR02647 family protein [Pseudoalteromonas sp. DL2-H2.2]
MAFDEKLMAELELLVKFPRSSLHQGIKIHKNADQDILSAAERLYAKGVIDQPDGGYLTDLGHDLLVHLDQVHSALK